MPRRSPPLVLVVLDGWGLAAPAGDNAIAQAPTPTYDALTDRYPRAALVTSGAAVGLPAGQMGNSEVGHMNLGAGRIVYQDLTRIDRSIEDGSFFGNAPLAAAMDRCNGERALHLVGLVSNGGVHSHQRHLHALVDMARQRGVRRLFVHVVTDGRDTPPTSGAGCVAALERELSEAGAGRVATVGGRYYAMDRDRRWQRTARAWHALTRGRGRTAESAEALLAAAYAAGTTDEFIEPGVVVDGSGQPVGPIAAGDSVVLFNFRADRMRQLTRALSDAQFDGFERSDWPRVHCTTMTEYDATFDLPAAFPPAVLSAGLAEVLAGRGRTTLRLAETEKYAHVTYFFNGGEERPYAGEDRILVPSQQVPTYDLKPEMSAAGITEQLVADVRQARHNVIICNFANADMVGHTGRMDAVTTAVATLDRCLATIVETVETAGGTLVVTADHGNAEQMWDGARSEPHTAHTTNRVPLLVVQRELRGRGCRLRDGSLRDVAPTMLGMLGIAPPDAMTGSDLREWAD